MEKLKNYQGIVRERNHFVVYLFSASSQIKQEHKIPTIKKPTAAYNESNKKAMKHPFSLKNANEVFDLLLLLNYDSYNRKTLSLNQRILIHKKISSLREGKMYDFPENVEEIINIKLNIIKQSRYKYVRAKYNQDKELILVKDTLI